MSDEAPAFTILLPVHRPSSMLPYAIRSVQAQALQDFELFVICDGAPPETAECARAFAAQDSRIRVFEHPKGARNGEAYRHHALAEARGTYVCHIGDDDLWLPNFLTEMAALLQDVDFGNLSHVEVLADGKLNMLPGDLAVDHVRRRMMNTPNNLFGLSNGGYRLSAYRALPAGWSAAPAGLSSDLHMWRKFLAHGDLRFGSRLTVCMLKFAAGRRRDWPLERRREEIADWAQRMAQPGFAGAMTQRALLQLSQATYDLRLMVENLKAEQGSRPDLDALRSELKQMRSRLRSTERQLNKTRGKMEAVRKTLSWRLTRPFRRLARLIAR